MANPSSTAPRLARQFASPGTQVANADYRHIPRRAPGHRQHGRSSVVSVAALLALLVFLGGIVTPGALLLWQATSPTVVIAASDAGTFESATTSPGGFFQPTLSSVQTSVGSISVVGPLSALRGSPLVIEERNKSHTLRLCVSQLRATCAELAGTWAGPMRPTPAAAHTILFARRGLATDNLENWLSFGVLGLVLALLAVGVTAMETSPDDTDDSTPADDPPADAP